ncbi:hypothetical protein PghCCS26_37030 [Paenibacillus glycanilyticus]|uniref:Uncharacterized protein n=1 Tax=Paenibacillus glycanilyticus TaxID=126569 RepID=A0ABQ6NRD7_9BACL|nr:hypothetical protein PghCCS26_37030 [Paenibacillus glycanilyticus]
MNDEYYCKLLDQTVELGVCMDINFERERLFMADTLIKLNIQRDKANAVCPTCSYCPIGEAFTRPRKD